jgi:hypothetical protein
MSTLLSRQRTAIILVSVALIVAACGEAPAVVDPAGAPGATPTPIVQPSVVASAGPSASPADPADGPAASPTPHPSKAVTVDEPPVRPAPPIPTVWSKAAVVMSGECFSPTATVDSNGTFHVVSGCGMGIRYATSKDGKRWRTTTLPHLAHRSDVEPQLAVDGSTLYVAYTRQRQLDGGCGDSGLVDVGVYYRTRTLPNGRWSAPTRLGAAGAHLQSFRVVNGVIHETFVTQNREGPVSYGSLSRGTFRSLRIPGATGTSLRVGDDGRARIAYTTGGSIRYATVQDGRLSTRTVFSSKVMQLDTPSLVLGTGDRAYMAWAVHPMWGGGCSDGEPPDVKPGTYFGTDASGAWSVKRINALVTSPSLALDVSTGRLYAALTTERDTRDIARRPDGTWTLGRRIAGTKEMMSAVLRRDTVTGHLLLVGSRWHEGGGLDVVAFVKS